MTAGHGPRPDPRALPRPDAPVLRWRVWAVAMGVDQQRVAKMSVQQIQDELLTAD